MVSELNMSDPTLGAGKLVELAKAQGLPYSRATIGRMLRIIKRKCPVCGGSRGRHHLPSHLLDRDLLKMVPNLKLPGLM